MEATASDPEVHQQFGMLVGLPDYHQTPGHSYSQRNQQRPSFGRRRPQVALQLEQIIERFKGADAYVAHSCSFEQSFLNRHLGETTWV